MAVEVVVKGPGTVSNFSTGIGMGGGLFGSSLIYNLILTNNQTGILLLMSSMWGPQRILENTIIGRKQQSVGIDIERGSRIHIYQNTIKGHSVGVVTSSEIDAVIDDNLITHNQTGIGERATGFTCTLIRGNTIEHNEADGIFIGYPYSSSASASTTNACEGDGSTIQDNNIKFNGGSGIVVEVGAQNKQVVQDNIVTSNRENGIKMYGPGPGSLQVMGNCLSGNGTDLLWDGAAPVCGLQNIFDTSSPQPLPECQ